MGLELTDFIVSGEGEEWGQLPRAQGLEVWAAQPRHSVRQRVKGICICRRLTQK